MAKLWRCDAGPLLTLYVTAAILDSKSIHFQFPINTKNQRGSKRIIEKKRYKLKAAFLLFFFPQIFFIFLWVCTCVDCSQWGHKNEKIREIFKTFSVFLEGATYAAVSGLTHF
jgi:hypothetical protein